MQVTNDIVSLKNVYFRYSGTKEPVIENASLEIKRGELLVLTGDSGCGKSSLLRLINGLIPHFFEGHLEGTVLVDGHNPSEMTISEMGRKVASIFQDTKSQFFTTNTASEMIFAAQNYGVPKSVMKERLNTVYRELDLQDVWDKDIFSLSSGQRQKIAFAAAEVLNPEIYLLDEPSANLDLEATLQLQKRLELLKAAGKTIIVAEHRLFYLSKIADRILCLKHGKIVSESRRGIEGFSKSIQKELRCMDVHNLLYQNPEYPLSKPFLEFSGLNYSYNGKMLINNIGAVIPSGEITTVIGSNGAGKTTLCKVLAGLLKSQKGKFFVDAKTVKPEHMHRYGFFVMQETDYQLYTESCTRELTLGLPQTSEILKNAQTVLNELGMGEFGEIHPQALSGGQKQRIVVASAICSGKPIILLDEPTSGLDYKNMRAIAKALHEEAKKGKAVIVITHDIELMSYITRRALEITTEGTLIDWKLSSQKEFHELCRYMLGGCHEI